LQGLQSGPVNRIVKATEETAKNTGKIAKTRMGNTYLFS
jgi:hypothetical protein